MDNDLTALHAQVAKTDRLASTPTPVSYTRHISRSLMLWLLALPASVATVATPTPTLVAALTAFVAWVRSILHWFPYDRVGVVNADP
eukprot:30984-Pelagococcus_subviridis.AAC.10